MELADSTTESRPPGGSSIRVVIADDSAVSRGVIFDLLDGEPGIEIVGVAASVGDAIEVIREANPDVALVDVRMPDGGGPAVADSVTSTIGGTRVIAMSAGDSRAAVMEMLAAGATGYVTKGRGVEEFLAAIRRAASGESVLPPAIGRQLIDAFATSVRGERTRRGEVRAMRERVLGTITGEELAIAFQPIRELSGMAPIGYEALARFVRDGDRGPLEWFDEASQTGLTVDLELMAVRLALDSFEAIRGGDGAADCFVAVNASPATVCDDRFAKLLDARGDFPLMVEVTEHAAIPDYDVFGRAVQRLRRRDVRLAVDDAGAGYASLRHILNIDPDVIKLDIVLTRDIDSDPARRAMGRALVSFAKERGATVVAEGIETQGELDALRELQVPAGQGYHLGRPTVHEPAA
jgi:EAL domain-containing protein (putative c-di-GMP-specific phosphodiesterase class I)/CheY-like chemotaxis protein